MPRPKKENESRAKELLIDSFWESLERRPYDKITVASVVKAAGVNKNTFYYHYSNLDELARAAIAESMPSRLFVLIYRLAGMAYNGENSRAEHEKNAEESTRLLAEILESDPVARLKMERISLTVGRNGTEPLKTIVEESVLAAWSSELGIDRAQMGPQSLLAMTFFFSMISTIISYKNEHMPDSDLVEFLSMPFIARLRAAIPAIIMETFEQDGAMPPIGSSKPA